MSYRNSRGSNSRRNTWLVIGALVLIILLILWLTIADLWGDTDVAAWISPLLNTNAKLLGL
ncbi:MAG: hypothetical protein LIO90_00060 [Bacteroidales bacterium]|nr:hypothetical protein [Bacteroidales bacterium]